jgi:hypothetical protein
MLGWVSGAQLNALFDGAVGSGLELPEAGARSRSRQQEIIRMLALDYSAKEIASLLNISPSTVRVVRWKHRHAASGAMRGSGTVPAKGKALRTAAG